MLRRLFVCSLLLVGNMLLLIFLAGCLPNGEGLNSMPTTTVAPGPGSQRPDARSLTKLNGHRDQVTSLSWSPDGKFLGTGASDGTVRTWEAQSSNMVRRLSIGGSVKSVSWSPDGKYIAAGSIARSKSFQVWSTANWELVFSAEPELGRSNDASINSVAWSADSLRVAVGLQGHTPNGRVIDSWIRVYDTGSWRNSATLIHPDGVGSVTWSPHSNVITFWTSYYPPNAPLHSKIVSWDPDQGDGGPEDTSIVLEEAKTNVLLSFAWSPDQKHIAHYYTRDNIRDNIRIWDVVTGSEISLLSGHVASVYSIDWSADGKLIASGGWDPVVKLWDATAYKEVGSFNPESLVNAVAFAPDSKTLAAGCADGSVFLWQLNATP